MSTLSLLRHDRESTRCLCKLKVKEAGFVQRLIVRSSMLLKRSGIESHSFRLRCKYTSPVFFYLVSIRETAPPLTIVISSHLIAAYYPFIDPKRMKGWVGLVSWPTADGVPTIRATIPHKWLYPSAVGPVQVRVSFAGQSSTFYHSATPLTRLKVGTCSNCSSGIASWWPVCG